MFAEDISSQNEIKENYGHDAQFIANVLLARNTLYAVKKRNKCVCLFVCLPHLMP
jgi:hypothetical protein